mgnify:FL=1
MDLKKEIIDDIEKAQLSAEEILRKYDKESDKRELTGIWNTIINAICIVFCIFQVYTAAFGVLDAQLQRAVHLAFGFALVFLLYPMRASWSRKEMNWIDVGFAVLGVAVTMYIVVFYHDLVLRAGMNNETDYIIALIGTLLVIEGARRVVGWPMITIAILFVLYALFGRMFPGIMAHRGLGLHELVNYLYYTTEGIFGTPMGVSSTFIYLFILFGAYLETTGLGKFFIDISNAIAGWASGGPAKVAVISSALEGTVSGSSVANVVGSGSFTIPMMKKLGYGKDFAGAVEAAASTGGQLMPPVMGAAAFLMAEFVGVPYMEVVKAGVIPAILYFTGIWLGVHFEAKKLGLKGMSRDEMPSYKSIFMERGHLIIPLIAIIHFLSSGYTPMRAALVGIALAIASSCLRKSTRISFKDFVNGMINGSKGILGVLIACATAGIIIGVVTKTGVGLKMATALLDMAGGHLIPAMVFTMITSLILGMGVPTTANYVITSTIAAPALIQMGVPILAAHMFVFYFGIVADITPPVALAAYAGSGISGGDPLRTGINASKLAIAAFIIPYIFVLSPEILMIDATPMGVIFSCSTAVIGMVGVAAAMGSYFPRRLNFIQRALFFFGGLGLIDPGLYTDIAGVVLMLIGYMWSRKNPK